MTDYIRSNTNTASCGTQSLIQSNYSTCKSSTWLFRSLAYWVISPNIINSDLVFLVNGVGAINNDFVNDSLSLYPALYLTSETQIIDGVGTSSDPYQITI